MYRLYHNPRCSKSRETLSLLQAHQIEPEIREYLKSAPELSELQEIIDKSGKTPLAIMRPTEARFKELGLSTSDSRSVQDWLQIIHENPILLERPILVTDTAAALGRPPENVLAILPEIKN